MKDRFKRIMAFAIVMIILIQSLPNPVMEIKAEEEVTISNNTHNQKTVSANFYAANMADIVSENDAESVDDAEAVNDAKAVNVAKEVYG